MNAKFNLEAECYAYDIEKQPTAEETATAIREMLKEEAGIVADIKISGLTYTDGEDSE